MMRGRFLILLIIVALTSGNAQTTIHYFSIRKYDNSLGLLANKHQQTFRTILSPYGQMEEDAGNDVHCTSYLYQAQEYDSDLGVYFFPSRLYLSGLKRFVQPDPASQYHSSYLFVNGDPVNYTDQDGKAGKPLVLYSEDYRVNESIGRSLEDMQETLPNAHYVPMSDFLNGEVGDLSEWNGNVFVKSHISAEKGHGIPVERIRSENQFKTRASSFTTTKKLKSGESRLLLDDHEFGRMMVRFSESRGVPLKNITVGGCHGSQTAVGIQEGISEMNGKGTHPVKISGLKKGKLSYWAGPRSTFSTKYHPPRRAQYYIKSKGSEVHYAVDRSNPKRPRISHLKFYDEKNVQENFGQLTVKKDLQNYLDGEIPDRIAPQFEHFYTAY